MKVFITIMMIGWSAIVLAQPFGKGELIVLNKSAHNVSFFNLNNGQENLFIPVGKNPHEVAISPNEQYAAVTNYGSTEQPGSSISIIDLRTKKVTFTHQYDSGIKPHGIVFIDDLHFLFTAENVESIYLSKLFDQQYDIISTSQKISHMVAYDNNQQHAFIANIGSGSVTVIDVAEKKKIKDIVTGKGAEGIEINPVTDELWVTNREDNTITVISLSDLTIKHSIQTENFPIRVKFTHSGEQALVSCAKSGSVLVLNTRNYQIEHTVKISEQSVEGADPDRLSTSFGEGPIPIGILIHPDDKFAFVANTNADIITVIDLKNYKIGGRIKTRLEPDGLGWKQ